MSTAVARREPTQIIEDVVAKGDLKELSPAQRTDYYKAVCDSIGLNPLTKPFEYITLNGKLTLYARKDATDQLRKLHSVSVQIVSRDRIDDVYAVTARATDASGRTDESIGAVAIGSLKGDALCNALMKAETKAKRRVTLSICGLGMLDEGELETVQQNVFANTERHVEVMRQEFNQVESGPLGELVEPEPVRPVVLEGAQPTSAEWPKGKGMGAAIFAKCKALGFTPVDLANYIQLQFKLAVSDEPQSALDALDNIQLKALDQALAGEFNNRRN